MTVARSRWAWWFLRLSRRIWFRATFFALLSVASALLASPLGPLIPSGLPAKLGADAVGNILEILASSMLVVATFSLSTVIAAYAAASSGTTPRVTELLMQDPTAQNALSTFVGGFLFSLVGIIGLSSGIYGADGHIVLFSFTVIMVAVIVVTFLRWVDVLSGFGRIPDAINRTAEAAATAVSSRVAQPCIGGRPADRAPEMTSGVYADESGYVRHIDMAALQRLAEKRRGAIRVTATPGTFLAGEDALAETTFEPDGKDRRAIVTAFDVGDNRTFDQDPRYGISALSEIGIKALSPAINDPVTAIRVIDRLVRVLTDWGNGRSEQDPRFDRVYAEPLDADEVFSEAFSGLELHGANDVRIGVRLQRAFTCLAGVEDPRCAAAARRRASLARCRAESALAIEDEIELVRAAAPD